jgi:hypothetical protein
MADLTITIGSHVAASGVEVVATVNGNSVTATPKIAQFEIILEPDLDHIFQGPLHLQNTSTVTFSPTVVPLSNGLYLFSCTDNVPQGSTATISFNVSVSQAGKTAVVHDPTLILNPPG